MKNLEAARKDPDMALKIVTMLYELYAEQNVLAVNSITISDKEEVIK